MGKKQRINKDFTQRRKDTKKENKVIPVVYFASLRLWMK